jgi:hypothetical protein
MTYANFMAGVLDGSIYGSGISWDLAIVTKGLEKIEKSSDSMMTKIKESYRSDGNFFQAEVKRMADVVVPKCLELKDDAFGECATRVIASMPVLLEPTAPADAPVLNKIKVSMNSCTDSIKTKGYPNPCLDELFAYAKDLDNFGLPRNLKDYANTIKLLEGIRRESESYKTDNIEEIAFKESLKAIGEFGLDPDLKVITEYKKKAEGRQGTAGYAGSHTMALSRFPVIFNVQELSPDFWTYNFLHELGHMIAQRSFPILRASGYYTWATGTLSDLNKVMKFCNPDLGHHDLWHKAVVFASHMARRHFKTNGTIKTDEDYAKIMGIQNTYHACFEPRLPNISRPTTWKVDLEYAKNGQVK